MLPSPLFGTPAEPLMSSNESVCDPKERPGVHQFIKFVIEHQGGTIGRTLGPCNGHSGHAAGRAWDWMIRADVPEERARADELIDWLLANDAEMFRRAGLGYIIWDRKIWSAFRPQWSPYDGFDADGGCPRPPCRDPHISHVHFSFNWPGADGRTSFYKWLSGDQPMKPPNRNGNGNGNGRPTPLPVPVPQPTVASVAPAAIAFGIGFLGIVLLRRSRWWRARR